MDLSVNGFIKTKMVNLFLYGLGSVLVFWRYIMGQIYKNKLLLSSNEKGWRQSSVHGTVYDRAYKKRYKNLWDSVWSRDKNTCFYCGFKSDRFQEIHHLDDDHNNNKIENLVTVCPLCHQNFHLDSVSNVNGGKIIWLPEMSQQDLNHLCRSMFIAMHLSDVNNEYAKENDNLAAEKLLSQNNMLFIKVSPMIEAALLSRATLVDKYIQGDASEPINIASAFIDMSREEYANRAEFTDNLKLLHFKTRFNVQSKYWASKQVDSNGVLNWMEKIPNDLILAEEE